MTPAGPPPSDAELLNPEDPAVDGEDLFDRPPAVQAFTPVGGDREFTVVVNHLKSKGSTNAQCGPADPFAGNCNALRVRQANGIVDLLDQLGADDALLLGGGAANDGAPVLDILRVPCGSLAARLRFGPQGGFVPEGTTSGAEPGSPYAVTTRTSGAKRLHATTARIVGTAGVLGVAATIAGLSTFGSFTTSTAPVDTKVDTGVLSINVADAGDSLAMPFGGGLFLAGDSRSYRLDLVNDGNSALSTVTMTSRATASSILDTDTVNGLQLTVKNCSVPWTVADSVYSCPGIQTAFYSGPIVATGAVIAGPSSPAAGANSLYPGGVDHLLLIAALPSTASGDALEGATSSLDFAFNGVQRAGSAR